MRRRTQRRAYVPRSRGRYGRVYANRPYASQALIKWKWNWGGTIATVNLSPVLILAWDNLTTPYWATVFDGTDAIVINSLSSNMANQSTARIVEVLKYFRRYVQYGMKIKLRVTPVTSVGLGNITLFTLPLSETTGVVMTNPALSLPEIPGCQTRKQRAGYLATIGAQAQSLTISRYFSLGRNNPTWRAQRDLWMGLINSSGTPSNPSGSWWGDYCGVGLYTNDGATFTGTSDFRVEIETTCYVEAWDPRPFASL